MKSQHLRLILGAMVLFLAGLLAGCGGGGSTATTTASFPPSIATLQDPNVVAISVAPGPGHNVNIPYVTVRVCVPGSTSNCKDIDHVLLDTGSTGLRLFASGVAAAPALSLPAHTIGSSSTITECAQFLNALAWGSIKVADVVMGGELAKNVPIQLMDSSIPSGLISSCGALPLMTPSTLGANGILGVSLFTNDGQRYFNCTPSSSTCLISPQPAVSQQVQNPVTFFTGDNNGIVVQLPTVDPAGVGNASGYLIFGVGTRSNNLLGAANVVPVNAISGYFTTTFHGKALNASFMDSGSNGLFFNDPIQNSLLSTSCNTAAQGFYCPTVTQNLFASIALAGSSVTVNFAIANADALLSSNNYVFSDLGGTLNSTSFDWGLPFFYGRSVYTVIEGQSVGTIAGPFYAFTN